MKLPRTLRRALSIFLACTLAWLPLLGGMGVACAGDVEQMNGHAQHEISGKTPDQSYSMYSCHSVCASCALLSPTIPKLQLAAVRQFNNSVIAKVPDLDLPVQERPPRLI